MIGLYIHVPFCVKKCGYCDFYSVAGRLDLVDAYIDAVMRESQAYRDMSFDTLYLGGGTPSLLGPTGLTRLLDGLKRVLDLSKLKEATMEVNPGSATADLLSSALACGINRVSVGVQSLTDYELKSAGRIQTSAESLEALMRLKNAGFAGISADVIVGLPGQTWQTLHRTLEKLIQLNVEHLSVYCLSLEPGTPLAMNPPEDLPSDDAQAELFTQATDLLEGRGFIHYEISNFALKGHECQHNLNYWRGGEYVGLGPAAASHLNGKRFKNRNSIEDYIKNPTAVMDEIEELNPEEKAAEEAMLRLRLLQEGLDLRELEKRFGVENVVSLASRLQQVAGNDMLIRTGTRYRLPPSRVLTSNPIFVSVLG